MSQVRLLKATAHRRPLGAMIYAINGAMVALGVGLLVLQRPRMNAPIWRATITTLASIIGSGFLAWVAMGALCAAAYLFGAAIRRNMRLLEPMFASSTAPVSIVGLGRLSHLPLLLLTSCRLPTISTCSRHFLCRGWALSTSLAFASCARRPLW